MGKRKKTIGGILLLLVLSGGGYLYWASGEDANVTKVRQLQAEAFSGKGPPSREKMDEMRQAMDQLTPEQRDQVMRPMLQDMGRHMMQRIDDYFALSPEERGAYLDKEIREMEKRQKEFEAWQKKAASQGKSGNGQGLPPGGPGGGPGGPGGAPGGGGGPGGPGGPRGWPPPGMMDRGSDTAKQHRNEMLDHMTVTQRAKLDNFISDMAKRRVSQGLPAVPTPPGRPGPR